jgi:hypothetical protein
VAGPGELLVVREVEKGKRTKGRRKETNRYFRNEWQWVIFTTSDHPNAAKAGGRLLCDLQWWKQAAVGKAGTLSMYLVWILLFHSRSSLRKQNQTQPYTIMFNISWTWPLKGKLELESLLACV